MPITFRTAVEEDWPAICHSDARAFGGSYTPEEIEYTRPIHDISRFELALDGSDIVGVVGVFTLSVTVPGGAALPMGGLTWVATAATHRRQGLLTRLMQRSLADIDRRGEPVAMLAASEGGIYERFGFGVASQVRVTAIDRRLAQLRAEFQPPPGAVRFIEGDEALKHRMEVWSRFHRLRSSEVDRSEAWHRFLMRMGSERQGGFSPSVQIAHADGYAVYRVEPQWNDGQPSHKMRMVELIATTGEAHAALWHTLLGVDLVGTIVSRQVPVDDPLPYLLTDYRALRTTALNDGTWVNVRDVATCMAARTYGTADRFVVEVDGERWAIEGSLDGASCKRVRSRPDLTMDHPSIGALLLGGVTPSQLAAGGRLVCRDGPTLRRADAFFLTSPAPHCQTLY
ncbi:MAG TPA: GNAT family N-acetyltransferase [Ilumatobacteraceae bacterium]|jgi:predicted acetyltransferase